MSDKEIKFYRTGDAYGEFSNFYSAAIKIKGKVWRTSEHYFQAQKFAETKYEEEIRSLVSPGAAARKGRDRKLPLRKDWEKVKDNVMREAVRAKFSQHKNLKELLLSTNDSILIEHTTNDHYWGDGGNGSGRNMLGKILMEIRTELK